MLRSRVTLLSNERPELTTQLIRGCVNPASIEICKHPTHRLACFGANLLGHWYIFEWSAATSKGEHHLIMGSDESRYGAVGGRFTTHHPEWLFGPALGAHVP